MAHDVFISYSTKDKLLADAVCSHVEARGIRCWIAPRDVLPGANWAGSIYHAINSSKVVVLIFSSMSNSSRNVMREVSLAAESECVIVPFRTEAVEPSPDLAYYLKSTHWLDALTAPREARIAELMVRLESIVGHREPVPREQIQAPSTRKPELLSHKLRMIESSFPHLRRAGIALAVTGWCGIVTQGFCAVVGIGLLIEGKDRLGDGITLAMFLCMMVVNGFVVWAARQMLKSRRYTLVRVACIAVLFSSCPLVVIGLPIGIWGLIILAKKDVKWSFESQYDNQA